MATTYEIVKGISQAMTRAYDGAHDENGEPVKIGLKREEGNPLIDKRVMDGFGVKFHGNRLMITYHAEIMLKDIYGSDIEAEIDQMITDIASFLKKEYKKITGETLSLTPEGEVKVLAQNTSRVRSFVTADKMFKIGGIDAEEINAASSDRLEDNFRKFLELGGKGRAPNDKRKD